jgi:Family of unknown function (DUF5331)
LAYYESNREWIARMGIWMDYDGQRRPSSSFILAALSVLEPQLTQMFPFIVELSANPDRIVKALGLNFDPEKQLQIRRAQAAAIAAQKSGPADLPMATNTGPKALEGDRTEGNRLEGNRLEGDRNEGQRNEGDRTVKLLTPSTSPAALRELSRRDETCSGRQPSAQAIQPSPQRRIPPPQTPH